MKKYLPLTFLFIGNSVFAQIPEDVLRYSFFPQNGTARNLAIGGAMGSLGGDITANYVNPAGLGNYKTGEIVFTPGLNFYNNKSNFRDTKYNNKKNNFGIGPIGIVFGATNSNNPKTSQAISFAVMQTANYNNTVQYKGYNNYSSFSEQWSEEISRSGLSFDQIRADPRYVYGSAPALETYLVDTFRVNGNLLVKSTPEFILENNQALLQQKTIETTGGMYEIALGYAVNKNDKWLFGGSIGVPIVNYKNTTTFKESDTSRNTSNKFNNFEYADHYSTRGAGVNLKMGIIYRPKDYIRLGLALHSPTYMYSLTDQRNTNLITDTEDYNGKASSSSNFFTSQPGESKYTMVTPWKFLISGSYVFREVENVKNQKGFITADIEYVTHTSSSFYSANQAPTVDEKQYYNSLNNVIRKEYKGNFNFRVGGELKFNVLMARLGFAYYTNPYKDAALKANRMLVSGGIGYRHKGFFIDLTYIYSINKNVDFAYRLQDKSNTFASLDTRRGNIVASVGFKF